MSSEDVYDCGSFIKISIRDSKTKSVRLFTITEGDFPGINLIAVDRQYIQMHPIHVQSNCFLIHAFHLFV